MAISRRRPALSAEVIRPALPADVPLLGAVERSAAQAFLALPDLAWIAAHEVTPSARLEAMAAAGTCWVAGHGAVIAFLAAEVVGPTLHICELAVAETCQRRGLGARLIAYAVAHAQARSLTAITLTTFRDVPWNGPFYARLGFAEVSDPRLERLIAEEVARGLPAARRCGMRLAL